MIGVLSLLTSNISIPAETTTTSVTAPERSRVTSNSSILGPCDRLHVEVLDIPELSGTFSIGLEGTICLPRLRNLCVEGLTVEEMRYLITEQFRMYIQSPKLWVRSTSSLCRW